jgi:hypothetical protein
VFGLFPLPGALTLPLGPFVRWFGNGWPSFCLFLYYFLWPFHITELLLYFDQGKLEL